MKPVRKLQISVLPGSFAVCRLSPGMTVPEKVPSAEFWSVTVTDEEISFVLPEKNVLPGWKTERGWRCLKVKGPLEFDQSGIFASIASPLSDSGIPFFALSTFDTDYFLVREAVLIEALETLEKAGHEIA